MDCNLKQLIGSNLISGEGKEIEVYNPSNGELLTKVKGATPSQALKALDEANKAFVSWSKTTLQEREKVIRNFIAVLDKNKETLINLLIQETGKPLPNAEYDVQMLPNCLDFFIEEAKRDKGDILPDWEGAHANFTIRKPLGVVVGYFAWNFPLLNLGYKLGPILASGCTCVMKPSSKTPLCSMLVGQLAKEAGVPSGVINIIVGPGSSISKVLSSSSIPKMLTLIGSSNTGRKIIEQSSTSIKHFSLELGGNAPVIVMKDADVKAAALSISDLKYGNAGQVCVNANRVFVHKNIKDEFINEVKTYAESLVLGSGDQGDNIFMGPCVSKEAQNHMQELVEDAVSKGAKLIYGGHIPNREGYFFEPTILDNVDSSMDVYSQEIFGPIMPIIEFNDESNVVELANDTDCGLAAYLFTNDLKMAMKVSKEIDSGSVCVNDVYYHFSLPHGGCKESGVGKDCSTLSLAEYSYVQRISVKL